MKKTIYCLILSVLLVSCSVKKLTNDKAALMKKAYDEQNCFLLDNLMKTVPFDAKNPHLLLYKAMLDNVFNQSEESNRYINTLLTNYPTYFNNDSTYSEIYSLRYVNNIRLQEYKSAYNDARIIIDKYSHTCDSAEIDSYKNINTLIENLFDASKMEVIKSGTSVIPLKRDKANLFNIPVTINNNTEDFVFDTGANFSTITQSLARKYGIKPIGKKVDIGSATGIVVKSEIGIGNIKLKDIEVKNVVFLIMPDSALTFANGAYVIKGVVGFPVMHALQQFTIKDDKSLTIPSNTAKNGKTNTHNFALEGLTPLIKVDYKGDVLPFHFDTGAHSTDFYSLFFNKYKSDIVNRSTKKKVTYGGAGGTVDAETYVFGKIQLTAGNSSTTLDSVRISDKDLMGEKVQYIYGNFGQDYIKQFSEMNINFSKMTIRFSHKRKSR